MILKSQKKQVHQQAKQEQQAYILSVIVLNTSKLVQTIMLMKECLSAGKELILYKLVILLSIIIDFQF